MSEDPDLWNKPDEAQKFMQERNRLEAAIGSCNQMETELLDLHELAELSAEEGDDEVMQDLAVSLKKLADRARSLELEALLAGEADSNDTYLEIHAGAGGTESQDWANMLLRMYLR